MRADLREIDYWLSKIGPKPSNSCTFKGLTIVLSHIAEQVQKINANDQTLYENFRQRLENLAFIGQCYSISISAMELKENLKQGREIYIDMHSERMLKLCPEDNHYGPREMMEEGLLL